MARSDQTQSVRYNPSERPRLMIAAAPYGGSAPGTPPEIHPMMAGDYRPLDTPANVCRFSALVI
jgi:hypothetical protein